MQATVLFYKPTEEDFNGSVLGEDVVFVTINGVLLAGLNRDVSALVPPFEGERKVSKGKTKQPKLLLNKVEATRWRKSLVRAKADIIAKAIAASTKSAAESNSKDGEAAGSASALGLDED